MLHAASSAWLPAALPLPSPRDAIVVLAAFALMRMAPRLGMWLYALVALPGTLMHELAHFVVALLLRAQPEFPSLVPTRVQGGWRMGSVAFRAGPVRAAPIALAPLLLLPLAWWWTVAIMPRADWPLLAAAAWIAGALLSACLPSPTDLRLARPALLGIGGLAAAAAIAWLALR
jgi:hypothetical protein